MNPIPPQETFDTVARHLLTQAERAEDEDQCLYRSPDGLKCAAGCLIPDDKYESTMEGLDLLSPDVADAIEGHDLALVSRLQELHDRCLLLANWPQELRSVAAGRGLNSAVVDELEPSFREKIR